MANISLQGSITTCRVDQSEAARYESDRIFNPTIAVCPRWRLGQDESGQVTGMNSKGQMVCANSFVTKSAGCNSAMDRVSVENALRPQYSQYVTLNAEGITSQNMFTDGSMVRSQARARAQASGPNFGVGVAQSNAPKCGMPRHSGTPARLSSTSATHGV